MKSIEGGERVGADLRAKYKTVSRPWCSEEEEFSPRIDMHPVGTGNSEILMYYVNEYGHLLEQHVVGMIADGQRISTHCFLNTATAFWGT